MSGLCVIKTKGGMGNRMLCAASGLLWAAGVVSIQAVLAVRFRQLDAAGILGYAPGIEMSPERFAIWWAMGGPARGEMFAFSWAIL